MPGGIPQPLRALPSAAGFVVGGIFTLSLASSVAIRVLQNAAESKRVCLLSLLILKILFLQICVSLRASSFSWLYRRRLHDHVRCAKEKASMFASYAEGIRQLSGLLCMILLSLTHVFARHAMAIGLHSFYRFISILYSKTNICLDWFFCEYWFCCRVQRCLNCLGKCYV